MVTISSPYGAGGSVVGPAVAERLGLPFLDRAIPLAVARRLAVPLDEVLAHDERGPSGMERFLSAMARMVVPMGPDPLSPEVLDAPEELKAETEAVLRHAADTTGAVVLGRAGMVVLGGRPDTLCVRLDGPAEGRVARAMADGLDRATAEANLHHTDRAREAYVRTLYGAHQDDARLYHLVVDSTVLDLDACVEVIVAAARCRLPGRGDNVTNW